MAPLDSTSSGFLVRANLEMVAWKMANSPSTSHRRREDNMQLAVKDLSDVFAPPSRVLKITSSTETVVRDDASAVIVFFLIFRIVFMWSS